MEWRRESGEGRVERVELRADWILRMACGVCVESGMEWKCNGEWSMESRCGVEWCGVRRLESTKWSVAKECGVEGGELIVESGV